MIGIIDYGMGNVGSLVNMVERLGKIAASVVSPEEIVKAEKLILPGVGSFDNGIRHLKNKGLWDVLNDRVIRDQIPILCICLGMQLITNGSEEGDLEGLGWIDGECLKFAFDDPSLKIPHMGWNNVNQVKKSNLFNFVPADPRFYFVHSYYVKCKNHEDILTSTTYHHEFVSSIERTNVYATQFHPEKSHKYGMGLIQSFIEKC